MRVNNILKNIITRILTVIVPFSFLVVFVLSFSSTYAQSGSMQVNLINIDDTDFPEVKVRLQILSIIGKPILGLDSRNFRFTEDGQEMKIKSVRDVVNTEYPAGYILVIDVSGSMRGEPLEKAQEAALDFLSQLNLHDQVALVTFADKVNIVVPLTEDQRIVREEILKLKARGNTALYDGVNKGIEIAVESQLRNKSVIILGDGKESGQSSTSRMSAIQFAREKNIQLNTIALGTDVDRQEFQYFSSYTGGIALEAATPGELLTMWKELSEILKQQIEIVLESSLPGDGATHELAIHTLWAEQKDERIETFTARKVAPAIELFTELEEYYLGELVPIKILVSAHGGIDSVVVYLDEVEFSTLTDPPFRVELETSKMEIGEHNLRVVVADIGGAIGESQLVIKLLKPLVEIEIVGVNSEQPIINLNEFTISIRGDNETQAMLIELDSDVLYQGAHNDGPFAIDPYKYSPGTYQLKIEVIDTEQNRGITSQEIEIGSIPITITLPFDDKLMVSEELLISVTVVSQQEISYVKVEVNATQAERLTRPPYNFTLHPEALNEGNNTLRVTAADTHGEVAELIRTIIVPEGIKVVPRDPIKTALFYALLVIFGMGLISFGMRRRR